jgi:chromate transport protein ChrA
LPAFVIVVTLGRLVLYVRRFQAVGDFLKGVNAGVIALLIGTFITLAYNTLLRPGAEGALALDWLSVVLTVLAFIALERLGWTPLVLVVVGIGVGLFRAALNLL